MELGLAAAEPRSIKIYIDICKEKEKRGTWKDRRKACVMAASAHRNSVYDRNPITRIAGGAKKGRRQRRGVGEGAQGWQGQKWERAAKLLYTC